MKNNKGQALIEFIMILPVFIMLIMSMIDFSNIIIKKYSLYNDLEVICDLYKNNDSKLNEYVASKSLSVKYNTEDNFTVIRVEKNVVITSIMLNPILGKQYKVDVEKAIVNEQ